MNKEEIENIANTDFNKFTLVLNRIYKEEYVIKLEKELEQLKEIEKEHQKINGELRQEIKELKEDYNKVVHEATEFESKVYELQDRIDKTIECISQMIFKGYRDETIEYFATGEKSEFGIRAKVILEILKEDK